MAQRTGIQWRLLVCVVAVLSVAGCDLLDPVRPSVVPDVEVFGNLVSLAEQPDAPGEFVVQIKVSPPRLLEKASREEGDPPPPKDDALVARSTSPISTSPISTSIDPEQVHFPCPRL
jgi:hypothetical protein